MEKKNHTTQARAPPVPLMDTASLRSASSTSQPSPLLERTPGPNAFALESQRLHDHRCAGNAFYQQAHAQAQQNPPTDAHPAHRDSTPGADAPFITAEHFELTPAMRASWKYSQGTPDANGRPCLDLSTSPQYQELLTASANAMPTRRALIEERAEQNAHARSGNLHERTPVFSQNHDSACNQTRHNVTDLTRTPFVATEPPHEGSTNENDQTKPIKKSFLNKIKLFKNSVRMTPIVDAAETQSGIDENVPPKAQAVLGTSDGASSSTLNRTPSKRRGFLSRKSSDAGEGAEPTKTKGHRRGHSLSGPYKGEVEATPPVPPIPTVFASATLFPRTPSTAASQTFSPYPQRHTPQLLSRSQSLKLVERQDPPTPPAKDTPPGQKTLQRKQTVDDLKLMRPLPSFELEDTSPKRVAGFINNGGDLSPSRSAQHDRGRAQLVTKQSNHSMHASVVPDLIDLNDFEDIKSRVDGLGLEGFNTPPENVRTIPVMSPQQVYSPSIYSEHEPSPSRSPVKFDPLTRCGHPRRHTMDDLAEDSAEEKSSPASGGSSKGTIRVGIDSPLLRRCLECNASSSPASGFNDRHQSAEPEMLERMLEPGMPKFGDLPLLSEVSQASLLPAPLAILPSATYYPASKSDIKSQARSQAVVGAQDTSSSNNARAVQPQVNSYGAVKGQHNQGQSVAGARKNNPGGVSGRYQLNISTASRSPSTPYPLDGHRFGDARRKAVHVQGDSPSEHISSQGVVENIQARRPRGFFEHIGNGPEPVSTNYPAFSEAHNTLSLFEGEVNPDNRPIAPVSAPPVRPPRPEARFNPFEINALPQHEKDRFIEQLLATRHTRDEDEWEDEADPDVDLGKDDWLHRMMKQAREVQANMEILNNQVQVENQRVQVCLDRTEAVNEETARAEALVYGNARLGDPALAEGGVYIPGIGEVHSVTPRTVADPFGVPGPVSNNATTSMQKPLPPPTPGPSTSNPQRALSPTPPTRRGSAPRNQGSTPSHIPRLSTSVNRPRTRGEATAPSPAPTGRDRVTTQFANDFYMGENSAFQNSESLRIHQAQVQGEQLVNYANSAEGRKRRGEGAAGGSASASRRGRGSAAASGSRATVGRQQRTATTNPQPLGVEDGPEDRRDTVRLKELLTTITGCITEVAVVRDRMHARRGTTPSP